MGERGPWEEVEGDVGMEFISSSLTGGWVAPATAAAVYRLLEPVSSRSISSYINSFSAKSGS